MDLKIALVLGDDIFGRKTSTPSRVLEMYTHGRISSHVCQHECLSGGTWVLQALAMGADIIITGRVVDSACGTGALVHEFSLDMKDYDRIGSRGTRWAYY